MPEIKKRFKPNREFYFWLFICAGVLMFLCLDIPKEKDRLFTITTGLSCGGVASVLVAWLIDEANCQRDTQKATANNEAMFHSLFLTFDSSLQILAFEVAKVLHDDSPRKWHEWADLAYKHEKRTPDMTCNVVRGLQVFFDEIAEQVVSVIGQEAVLLESGIICEEDVRALSMIMSICDSTRAGLHSEKEYQLYFRLLHTNCGLLRGVINTSPSLKAINEIMVEPTLYKMYMESGDGLQNNNEMDEDIIVQEDTL